MSTSRRKFLKVGLAGAVSASALGAPAILKAQSDRTFNWRMTTTWPSGIPFYQSGPGSAEDIAAKIREASDGRLNIQVYSAGELVPAFEGFDACSEGIVEMNHGCSYYWGGKSFASQYFTTVPFGMTFQGFNAWLSHGGGQELWDETYERFGVMGLPVGCTGVQMVGWFREPIETVDDLDGVRMRIPGLAGRIYEQLGVNVSLLPGGEIFPALERGVIDAAEWVGPYLDRRLGLHRAAKHYYASGWHEPCTTSELLINKRAFESLPSDLKAIVRSVAAQCNLLSHTLLEQENGPALDDLINNHGVTLHQFSDDIIDRLREATFDTLETEANRDSMVRKVHDSFFAFKEKHDHWNAISEGEFQTRLRDNA
ncbi:MAG: TRAP transporter substrate-binding protein [Ectothiorhodospiraceae bacterium]|nr:TRAP transporter substrate-binding protein [Ectothiorhodospiraceae bacterium]MCH8503202.1 TRAP transporter substrate-binding protein [Ectothiorhodospiraceae bacterium]